jgi:hypothetical protein
MGAIAGQDHWEKRQMSYLCLEANPDYSTCILFAVTHDIQARLKTRRKTKTRNFKNTDFVDIIMSEVLSDIPCSRNQLMTGTLEL